MELTGESRIAAPRQRVWDALNDPETLARCIEGVETLTRSEDDDGRTRFEGKMVAKVGPVRATFAGAVTVTEPESPRRYVLVGEGKGGVAGFAKGQAEVILADSPDAGGSGTLLTYAVTSSVGGKLAQLGSRLIEGTAKGYAATFFERFKAEVEGPPAAVDSGIADTSVEARPADLAARTADPQAIPSTEGARAGLSPLLWGGALVVAVIALLVWQLT